MCGIAGKCNLTSSGNITLELLKDMTAALHHRGPDECGIYVDDWVGLCHTRLSIVDLSTGSQPIHNEDKSLWIIYNGEVFNYVELREELVKKGHRFYTTSDTEVVLHLYEEKGSNCLEQLNGQFAIAIWNTIEKELFLARDRVGIRPLYYTVQNNSLLFASEVKSMFMDKGINRQIDPVALNHIFTFWTTLPGQTIFKNIKELSPGHYLKLTNGNIIIKKYWDIPFTPPSEQLQLPENEIIERIQELLMDAIRIRLRADVPVGCYVSGGLDSSGLTSLVVKNFNSNVKTFGIRFEEPNFDEGEFQNLMVSFLGTEHIDIRATNERIGNSFAETLWHIEKPILRTAPIPLFLLSDVVYKNGLKVVLTGEGADEVFGGYNIFREAKVRNFWAKQPTSQTRGLLIEKLYPYIFDNPRTRAMQRSFFAVNLDKFDDPFFSHLIRWQNTSKIKTFLSDDFIRAGNNINLYEELAQFLPPSFSKWDYLAKAQYLEMTIFLSNYLLSSQGDRVAMAHSLEIRLPYLDYRLIDFMGKVPAKWKIKGLNEKYILKKSFENVLPHQIVKRTKHPYRAPIKQSLLNESTMDMLSRSSFQNSFLFNNLKVERLLKKLQSAIYVGETDNMALVGILSTHHIHEQFIKNFPDKPVFLAKPNLVIDNRSKKQLK